MSVDDLKECTDAARQQGVEQGIEQMQDVAGSYYAGVDHNGDFYGAGSGFTENHSRGVLTIANPGRYRVVLTAYNAATQYTPSATITVGYYLNNALTTLATYPEPGPYEAVAVQTEIDVASANSTFKTYVSLQGAVAGAGNFAAKPVALMRIG